MFAKFDDLSDNMAQTIDDYVYKTDNDEWPDKVSHN